MAKRRNQPTATAPPTVGEGCLARYDPQALADTDGTDFPAPPNCGSGSTRLAPPARQQRTRQQAHEHRPACQQVK